MKAAISQPTYLPWLGYFDLIDQADMFVFLDGVQFDKRSWQQRNRIKGSEGLILLTVPVAVKGRFEQAISEVEIAEPQVVEKHRRAIEMNYRRAPYFARYWPGFSEVLQLGWSTGRLCELNIALIEWCMRELGINKKILRCSSLPCQGRRSELLLSVCKHLSAHSYLSAYGSAVYLLPEEGHFSASHVELKFQNYVHPTYDQLFPPFVPYASVIDLIFNLGDKALEVLRSGRQESFTVAAMRQKYAEQVSVRT